MRYHQLAYDAQKHLWVSDKCAVWPMRKNICIVQTAWTIYVKLAALIPHRPYIYYLPGPSITRIYLPFHPSLPHSLLYFYPLMYVIRSFARQTSPTWPLAPPLPLEKKRHLKDHAFRTFVFGTGFPHVLLYFSVLLHYHFSGPCMRSALLLCTTFIPSSTPLLGSKLLHASSHFPFVNPILDAFVLVYSALTHLLSRHVTKGPNYLPTTCRPNNPCLPKSIS